MTIENTVSNDFWSRLVDSIDVFDCRLPGVLAGHSVQGGNLHSGTCRFASSETD